MLRNRSGEQVTDSNGQSAQLTDALLPNYPRTLGFTDGHDSDAATEAVVSREEPKAAKGSTIVSALENPQDYSTTASSHVVLVSSSTISSRQQGEGENKHMLGVACSSFPGAFIPLRIDYKDQNSDAVISPEEQAETILDNVRKLYDLGYQKIGITYSANSEQRNKLLRDYPWWDCIKGSQQAQVVRAMGKFVKSDERYTGLSGVFKIFPLVSVMGSRTALYDRTIVSQDLDRLKRAIRDDAYVVFAWQNQETVKDSNFPFAFGGGVSTRLDRKDSAISEEQRLEVQRSLCRLIDKYEPTESVKNALKHVLPPTDTVVARVPAQDVQAVQARNSSSIFSDNSELGSRSAVSSRQQGDGGKNVLRTASSLLPGALVPLRIDYEDQCDGAYFRISAEEQAEKILENVQKLYDLGYRKIGITYSASKRQRDKLLGGDKSWWACVEGRTQAAVVRAMGVLLESDRRYTRLWPDVFEIFPLVSSFSEGRSYDIGVIKKDIEDMERKIQNGGYAVFAWQNQDTVKNSECPFAFADGASSQHGSRAISTGQKQEVQKLLRELGERHKPTESIKAALSPSDTASVQVQTQDGDSSPSVFDDDSGAEPHGVFAPSPQTDVEDFLMVATETEPMAADVVDREDADDQDDRDTPRGGHRCEEWVTDSDDRSARLTETPPDNCLGELVHTEECKPDTTEAVLLQGESKEVAKRPVLVSTSGNDLQDYSMVASGSTISPRRQEEGDQNMTGATALPFMEDTLSSPTGGIAASVRVPVTSPERDGYGGGPGVLDDNTELTPHSARASQAADVRSVTAQVQGSFFFAPPPPPRRVSVNPIAETAHSSVAETWANVVSLAFGKYQAKPGSKREELHKFVDDSVRLLGPSDRSVLIGLMLFCRSVIGGEYHFMSPKKGCFFGSRMYSAAETALKKMGVNTSKMTTQEKMEHCSAFRQWFERAREENPSYCGSQISLYMAAALRTHIGVSNRLAEGQLPVVFSKFDKYPLSKVAAPKRELLSQFISDAIVRLEICEDSALIGLMLFCRSVIGQEYRFMSPKKGCFFGSRMYSAAEAALEKMGVNMSKMTLREKDGYYAALRGKLVEAIRQDSSCDRQVIGQVIGRKYCQYILDALSKELGSAWWHEDEDLGSQHHVTHGAHVGV